jgi:WD repeat-containing protein 35
MCWSDDNPELMAMMEKTRMYIFRRMQPEEPVVSSAYICAFSDLRIKGVLLDEVFATPETPDRQCVVDFETKSLRDTQALLATVGLADAASFVAAHPHGRLWRLLAEAALERLEWSTAERAFVHCSDFQGITLVRRLRTLDDPRKQRAEVCAYFRRFEEAEAIYLEMDRRDLAVELRARLGSWFRVVQLLEDGAGAADDERLREAWRNIGDYYADRLRWDKAAQFYREAGETASLAECLSAMEDYTGLRKLVPKIDEASPLLLEIGERFRLVGLCEEAVEALVRAGEPQLAIDACVELNQWDTAVRLAERHGVPRIDGLLSKYATHLLDKSRVLEAVELYRKAGHHSDAAHLLMGLGREALRDRGEVLMAKKLYTLAAMEVDAGRSNPMRNNAAAAGAGGGAGRDMGAVVEQLEGMLADGADDPAGGAGAGGAGAAQGRFLGNPWRGAEAHHLLLLCQRFLYRKEPTATGSAMAAAQRLTEYEDILPALEVYSLVALTAFMNGHYEQCSLAFMKLETDKDIPEDRRKAFADLALEIFSLHPPIDPEASDRKQCPSCHAQVAPWQPSCACGTRFPPCMATGLPVINAAHTPVTACRQCHAQSLEVVVRRMRNCPLCHFPLDPDDTAALTR